MTPLTGSLRLARRVPPHPHYTTTGSDWYMVTIPVRFSLPWLAHLLALPLCAVRGTLRVHPLSVTAGGVGLPHGLVLHEAIHALAQRDRGMLRWLLAYGWGLLRHGVSNHPMEAQAAREALELLRGTHPTLSLDLSLAGGLPVPAVAAPLPRSAM